MSAWCMYALEGAIIGRGYNQLPEKTKRDLKEFHDYIKPKQ